MEILSKLSPAETMLLIDSTCRYKDMLKFTFMDLLLKRVIEIKVENKKVLARDKYAKKVQVIKSYNYVVKGRNFIKYKPKGHELVFLSPYQKSTSIKILFKHLIKVVYENSGSSKSFKSTVLNSINLKGLLKVNILQQLFGGISMTAKGNQTKVEILKYLKPIDQNINNLLKGDKKKALELLLSLGGNIFLLNNLDFALLKKIDKLLLDEQKSNYSESYDTTNDWWYYFDFYDNNESFDFYFDDFDSTINSFESDYDAAGCSSCNTGCSSCGGCGGCD
ncbi:hypothetical protein [Crocinitomix catalasitica]|uniref:hypothetical protein n=1 Tax=Crocinitomix catalasitica TaxID=184607 RepID=UPI00048116B0|nr:hypothetical protein [Crocinitomix catalasitica]